MAGKLLSVVIILGLIAAWFLLLEPVFSYLARTQGVLLAYGLFLVGYVYVASKLGFILKVDRLKTISILLAVLIFSDLVFPPLLIRIDSPPTQQVLTTLSSDAFVYTLVVKLLNCSHTMAWFITYIGGTVFGLVLTAYALGFGRAKRFILGRLFNGF